MVKVIFHKTAWPPQMDGWIVFTRWRIWNMIEIVHIGATWQIRFNSCFLRPTRVHNPNGKSIGLAVCAQLTAESPYTLQWVTLSLKIAPSYGGSGTPSNTWFIGTIPAYNPNGISTGSVFLHRWPHSVSLYFTMGRSFPHSQNCPFDLHLINGSLGPPKSSTQMASRLVQPFVQGSLV